jgi:hypothetical protein
MPSYNLLKIYFNIILLNTRIFLSGLFPSGFPYSRGAARVLMWRPDGKKPLGRPRPRLKDNIKRDF